MAAHQHLAGNHSHTNKFFRDIKKPACICYPTGGGIGSLKPRLHMAGGVLPSLFLACLKPWNSFPLGSSHPRISAFY